MKTQTLAVITQLLTLLVVFHYQVKTQIVNTTINYNLWTNPLGCNVFASATVGGPYFRSVRK